MDQAIKLKYTDLEDTPFNCGHGRHRSSFTQCKTLVHMKSSNWPFEKGEYIQVIGENQLYYLTGYINISGHLMVISKSDSEKLYNCTPQDMCEINIFEVY